MVPEIIKDICGGKLRLSTTRLTELTGESSLGQKWYLHLRHLRISNLNGVGPYRLNDLDVVYICRRAAGRLIRGNAFVDASRRRIGCRFFSKTVFRKIMKAAGITKGING